jgi:hypothetical protein
LIDLDINRLSFVYDRSVQEEKDSLYEKALRHLIDTYPHNRTNNQTKYLLAAFYHDRGSRYQFLTDTAYRYDKVKAVEILREVIKDSAVKNEGWANSYHLFQEITHLAFSFQVEKVTLPEQPFRVLAKYRNATKLFLRLLKRDEALKNSLEDRNGEDRFWSALVQAPYVRDWQQPLPRTDDLQEHAVEIKIDGLPVGEYYLLASTDAKFDKAKSSMEAALFYVSSISYVNQGPMYFVLDRASGKPLPAASVQVFHKEFDYNKSRYINVKQGTYQTNSRGQFELKKKKGEERYYSEYLDIRTPGDRLAIDEGEYGYYFSDRQQKEDSMVKVFFFADRSIYRPGQKMYFKGIVVRKGSGNSNILVQYKTKIYLQNANGERIDSLQVMTNEYGSFSGFFTLPQSGLNGSFRIYDVKGNDYDFSVEEYKRPGFYIDFKKIRDSYKVGEKVTVTGFAKAYAGNTIDGAKVAYRVVRQARFPYPWLFRKGWFPPVQPMEIAHGTTTTDSDGNFTVAFTAIPDKTIDRKREPLFDYRIYADITDINGETRTGERIITAGYKSLLLQFSLPEKTEADALRELSIRTENMNGMFQPAVVTVSFTKLIPERRLVRERYWEQPDQFVMSKEEFLTYFPHDEYRSEKDPRTWEKGELAWQKTAALDSQAKFKLDAVLPAAYYEVSVATRDKDGQEVKDIRYIEITGGEKGGFTQPGYLWVKTNGGPIEPGESRRIDIGSAARDVYLIRQTDQKSKKEEKFEFSSLDNQTKSWTFTATEEDRGGYNVTWFFIKDNRFYQVTERVQVPWTNKELKIAYTTFRDKTLPGSEERWTVKLSGYKSEKLAAEMLVSMYDASLDQFRAHDWQVPGLYPAARELPAWSSAKNFTFSASVGHYLYDLKTVPVNKRYDYLSFGAYNLGNAGVWGVGRGRSDAIQTESAGYFLQSAAPPANPYSRRTGDEGSVADTIAVRDANDPSKTSKYMVKQEEMWIQAKPLGKEASAIPSQDQPRRNFMETAFFFPDLKTDENGSIAFSFTMPEALTRWKLQTFAHTKELAFGLSKQDVVTRKDLMVQLNAPRFLRQGDRMELSAKIVNQSDKEVTGQLELQLTDAATGQPVDGWFMNTFPHQYFTVAASGSEVVKFPVQVPYLFNSALVWRITARTKKLSDGEENTLPVLSNKILVTETLPLTTRGEVDKTFRFERLLGSAQAVGDKGPASLEHRSLTVEYTSNPAWYVVQALPYLMEFPYECAEQTWNRYYATALAAKVAQATPRIRQIFEQRREKDSTALLSNLQKNEELKSALLEETPWVLEAKSETEQKKNIGRLFEAFRLGSSLKATLRKLAEMQSPGGGFVWFKGGPDDRYITQYIVTGIGRIRKLGVNTDDLNGIMNKALPYLDKKIREDYDRLVRNKAALNKQQISPLQIQYLYLRSFFTERPLPPASQAAYSYFRKQARTFWMKQNKLSQGMIAVWLHRTGDPQTPASILKSLQETAVVNEETGMFWKDNSFGDSWFWWDAPVETQSLLIEAFSEISRDNRTIDALKTWLLKNKQTNHWETTKATADACYAFLLHGTDWLASEPAVEIKLGNTLLRQDAGAEAGTGYFKKTIEAKNVRPEMGQITVHAARPGNPPGWGAVYWQYFEDMDKITAAATPLLLNKKLFLERASDRGPVLVPLEGAALQVGDKIKVRIELRVDREMEYVHMKDLRASALEPVHVLSGYKWQGGLGYYETTKDAATHFFFHYLPKGSYVFEYGLVIAHSGNFSNGMTTIQCMYAPEFAAHSEGIRIDVENK